MIYHFTDTARLAWILHDGNLIPGRCRVGGYPDPDFLWATANMRGDRSASGGTAGFKDGLVRLVRISLHAEDFIPWRDAADQHPDWTKEHIRSLEDAASKLGMSQSEVLDWRCRRTPLPVSRFIAIETRTWQNNTWRPLPIDDETVIYARQGDRVSAGVEIGGVKYFSERTEHPTNGRRGYAAFRT